ncbi:MAG: tetratricopeptide repeat protein [Thaumarchaeota archaeon]|nr:tetratricopeptide repeat protein [Nitrososphaerota archaeon]
MAESGRRLAAIMFTDIVNYTALAQTNEPNAMALLKKYRELIRPMLVKYGGREVKTMGDAFLVEFESALAATECAAEVDKVLQKYDESAPESIRVRIGIHVGDVIHEGGDVYGDAVNIASRIEPLAEGGGVCISQQVYDQVRNKVPYTFSKLEQHELKNVSIPIEVYRLGSLRENYPSEVVPTKTERSRRLAVLPFVNISPASADEYFADGMTDEMISTLSRIGDLRVISRTSVMSYKGTKKSMTEIARELNVGSILEGSVRKAGDDLRITVQLIDAKNDEHLWSQDYDRKLKNVIAIQSDIAHKVAEALRIQLFAGDRRKLQGKAAESSEAYTLYLQGRYFWNKGTLDDFNNALDKFDQAIKRDSKFAPAYSGLADTYLLMGRNGHVSPRFAYPKAIEYAQKAIALDAELPEPHVALAAIRQEYEWKWEEAGFEFTNAVRLNPSYASGHAWYALYLGHLGRIDEAIGEAQRAQEFDPLSPRVHCVASEEYLFNRDYDKAIEAAERALEINSNFGGAYGYRGYAYVEKKMYDEAIDSFHEAGKLQGARAWMGRLGHAYAISGRITEAAKILDELKSQSGRIPPKSPFIPPPPDTAFDIGLVYLGLGDSEQAIDWLQKAADERTAEIIHVKCEPIYESIRNEPRFLALMKRIGLDQ